MKFLKYYKDSLNDRQYELYTFQKYLEKVKNLSNENFTEKEKEKLRKIFPKYLLENSTITKSLYVKKLNNIIIRLYKYTDEWYFVDDPISRYIFLCDGFQGLINCITDEYSIS